MNIDLQTDRYIIWSERAVIMNTVLLLSVQSAPK